MMPSRPLFLERLDLAPDAGEREVRRAYARELKLIDQENDLEGFQSLRASYEEALRWAAQCAEPQDGGAHEAAVVLRVDPTLDTPDQTSPAALAHAVFTAFRARMAVLTDLHGGHDSPAGVAAAIALLHDTFADPRLLHLDTRAAFEREVAASLSAGWRPGHEVLLPAAIEVFHWDGDPQALSRLGHPGRVLDQVLDERAMFQSQDQSTRAWQLEVLDLLRHSPSFEVLTSDDKDILFGFQARFPSLLRILVPRRALPSWDDYWLSHQPGAEDSPATTPNPDGDATRKRIVRAFWIFMFLMLAAPPLILLVLGKLMTS